MIILAIFVLLLAIFATNVLSVSPDTRLNSENEDYDPELETHNILRNREDYRNLLKNVDLLSDTRGLEEWLETIDLDSSGIQDFDSYFLKHRLSPLAKLSEKQGLRSRNSFMYKNRIYAEAYTSHTAEINHSFIHRGEESENTPSNSANHIEEPLYNDGFVGFGDKVRRTRERNVAKLESMKISMMKEWRVRGDDYPFKDISKDDIHDLNANYVRDVKLVNQPFLKSYEDTFYPTSQPSRQPTAQPFADPTSQPTASEKLPFKVYIDKYIDGKPPTTITEGTCPYVEYPSGNAPTFYSKSSKNTYVDQGSDTVYLYHNPDFGTPDDGSGDCNYRTAVQYCLQKVPYNLGHVSECVIVFPINMELSLRHPEEIVFDVKGIVSKHPVNVVFEGRGSTITGNFTQHFMTTTPKNDTNYNISTFFQDYSQFNDAIDFNTLRRLEATETMRSGFTNAFRDDAIDEYSSQNSLDLDYYGESSELSSGYSLNNPSISSDNGWGSSYNSYSAPYSPGYTAEESGGGVGGVGREAFQGGDVYGRRLNGHNNAFNEFFKMDLSASDLMREYKHAHYGNFDPDPEADKLDSFDEEAIANYLRHNTAQDHPMISSQDATDIAFGSVTRSSNGHAFDAESFGINSNANFNKDIDLQSHDLFWNGGKGRDSRDGSIYVKLVWTTMTFKNLTLVNFGFPASNGGCLKLAGLRGVILDHVTLRNCSGVLGGGLFVQNTYFVDVFNSKIDTSQGLGGGAAFIYYTQQIRIFNTDFIGNYAKNIGGAVIIDNTFNVSVVDCNFTHNSAYWGHGGALSIVNVFSNSYVKHSHFIDNFARYGSAVAMAGGHEGITETGGLFCDNFFDYNKAAKAGTIYWLYASGMTTPRIPTSYFYYHNATSNTTLLNATHCFNNFTTHNYVGFKGKNIQTEPTNITADPPVSIVSNYSSAAFPVDIRVDMFDHYGNHVRTPKGTNVTILKKNREDCNCDYNTDNCVIVQKTMLPIYEGYARFNAFQLSCIPSDPNHNAGMFDIIDENKPTEQKVPKPVEKYIAYIRPTFSVYVGLEAFDYPRYTSIRNYTNHLLQKRLVEGSSRIVFRECVTGEKYDFYTSTRSTCSVCKNEYLFEFKSNKETKVCIPCPKPVKYCIGKDFVLYPGTFRWTNVSTRIYECPLIGGCKGGIPFGAAACGPNNYGPWCGLCKPGYYQSKQTVACESCLDKHVYSFEDLFFILLLTLAVAIPFFSAIIKTYLTRDDGIDKSIKDVLTQMKLSTDLFSTEAEVVADMLNQVEVIKKARAASWMSRLKMTLVTYQIISQTPQTLQMDFPNHMNYFISSLGALNLDFLRIIPVSCYGGIHFIEKLYMMTLFPFVIAGCLIVIYVLNVIGTYLTAINPLMMRQKESELRFGYLTFYLVLLYFLVPGLSTLIFQTFDCVAVDELNESEFYQGFKYLRVDFEVNCATSYYKDGLTYAYSMVGIYPVAVPVIFFLLLYSRKEEIIARVALEKISQATMVRDGRDAKTLNKKLRVVFKRLSGALSFLYVPYEPKFWYWEIVEITRRLMLTSFLSIIFAGTVAQVTISIAFGLVYIKVYNYSKPYLLPSEDNLSETCQYQIFFTFFSASVFLQQSLGADLYMYEYLDASLVFFNSFAIFLNIYYFYNDFKDMVEIRRQMTNSVAMATLIGSSQLHKQIIIQSVYMPVDENLSDKKRMEQLATVQKEPIKLVKEKWKTKFDMTLKEDVKLFIEIVNNMSDDDVFRMQAMIYENIIKYERRCADKIWIYCQDPILIGTFNDVRTGKANDNALIHAMPLRVQRLGESYEETKDDLVNPRVPVPKYVKDLLDMDVGFTGELFRSKKELQQQKEEARDNEEKGGEDREDDFDDYEYQMDEQRYDDNEKENDEDLYDENGVQIRRPEDQDDDRENESDEEDVAEYKRFINLKKEEMRAESAFFDVDDAYDDEEAQPRSSSFDRNNGNGKGHRRDDDYDNDNDYGKEGDDGNYGDRSSNIFDDLSDDGQPEIAIRDRVKNTYSTPAANRHDNDDDDNNRDNDNDGGDDSPAQSRVSVRQVKTKRFSYSSDRSSVSELDISPLDRSRMKRNMMKQRRNNNNSNNADSTDYDTDQSLGFSPKIYYDKQPQTSEIEDSGGLSSVSELDAGKMPPRSNFKTMKRNIIHERIDESGSEESSVHKSVKSSTSHNAAAKNANIRSKGKAASDVESTGIRSDRGFSDRGKGEGEEDDDDDNDGADFNRGYNTKASAFLDKTDNSPKDSTGKGGKGGKSFSSAPLKAQVNSWGLGDDAPAAEKKVSDGSKPTPVKKGIRDEDDHIFASDYSTEGEIHLLRDYDEEYDYAERRDSERDSEAYDSPSNNFTKRFAQKAFENDISIDVGGGSKKTATTTMTAATTGKNAIKGGNTTSSRRK